MRSDSVFLHIGDCLEGYVLLHVMRSRCVLEVGYALAQVYSDHPKCALAALWADFLPNDEWLHISIMALRTVDAPPQYVENETFLISTHVGSRSHGLGVI